MKKISEVSIGKILGKGYKGTVYLAADKNKNKYALKIEQIRKVDIEKINRMIEFSKVMSKYPNHFMQIYDYKIDDNNKYKHNHIGVEGADKLNDAGKRYYQQLFASPYSCTTLNSIVDGIFGQMTFNKKVFYDLFIQYMYIIYLIDKEKFMHADLHQNNIGVIKTNKETLNILGYNIPTHGYYLQALDYGTILSKHFNLSKTELKRLKSDNDVSPVINSFLIKFNTLIKTYKELKNIDIDEILYKIKINKSDYDDCRKMFPKTGLYKEKNEEKFLTLSLYKLKYYDKLEQHLLGDKLKKPIPPDLLLPEKIITYIICNIANIESILMYLIKNQPNINL